MITVCFNCFAKRKTIFINNFRKISSNLHREKNQVNRRSKIKIKTTKD